MKTAVALWVLVSASGCAESQDCCLVEVTTPRPPPRPSPPPCDTVPTSIAALPTDRVLVLESSHLARPSEVVGVIDVHAEMGGHDSALELLKERAVQLGADAVLGVEFHHGHGEDEPTHLSGLAVRFTDEAR